MPSSLATPLAAPLPPAPHASPPNPNQAEGLRRTAACLVLQRYARRCLARHEVQRLRRRRMQLAMCAQQSAWAARARLPLPLEVQSEATRTSLLEMGTASLRRPFGVGAMWRGSV